MTLNFKEESSMFLYESARIPPSGTTATPFGFAPSGVRLRYAEKSLWLSSASLRTKDKTFGRFAPHKSICNDVLRRSRAAQKHKRQHGRCRSHKGVFFGVCSASIAPRRTRAKHQCILSEVYYVNECPPSGLTLTSASQAKPYTKASSLIL